MEPDIALISCQMRTKSLLGLYQKYTAKNLTFTFSFKLNFKMDNQVLTPSSKICEEIRVCM